MSDRVEKAAEWVYRGVWKVLSDWFRVPERPPTLPVAEGEVDFEPGCTCSFIKPLIDRVV